VLGKGCRWAIHLKCGYDAGVLAAIKVRPKEGILILLSIEQGLVFIWRKSGCGLSKVETCFLDA